MNPQLLHYLQELEDVRRPATLRFLGGNGGVALLTATIQGLQTEGDEPGFWAGGTLWIPLRNLLQVNGFVVQAVG